jgi:hypothetical protein
VGSESAESKEKLDGRRIFSSQTCSGMLLPYFSQQELILTDLVIMSKLEDVTEYPIFVSNKGIFWDGVNQFFSLLDEVFWFKYQKEFDRVKEWVVTSLSNQEVEALVILRTMLKTLCM